MNIHWCTHKSQYPILWAYNAHPYAIRLLSTKLWMLRDLFSCTLPHDPTKAINSIYRCSNIALLDSDTLSSNMPDYISTTCGMFLLLQEVTNNLIKHVIRNFAIILINSKKFNFTSKYITTNLQFWCQFWEVDVLTGVHGISKKCWINIFSRTSLVSSMFKSDNIGYLWCSTISTFKIWDIELKYSCEYHSNITVRGTPYASDDRPSSASASDSRLPSAPATSSLFCNAFGRMTSYATRSRPASTPDRMMSRDVAWCRKTHRPDPTSLPTHLPSMTRWHDTYAVSYTYFLISDWSLISIISYISPHLQVDPYPFLFGWLE